jgi:hypothetical protein
MQNSPPHDKGHGLLQPRRLWQLVTRLLGLDRPQAPETTTGKDVLVIDTARPPIKRAVPLHSLAGPNNPAPAIPAVTPTKDESYERAMAETMRTEFRIAFLNLMIVAMRDKLALREQDVARLQAHNAYLEAEVKLQALHHTNALKDNMALKRQLAQKPAAQKPAKRSPQRTLAPPVHGVERGPQQRQATRHRLMPDADVNQHIEEIATNCLVDMNEITLGIDRLGTAGNRRGRSDQ